MNGDVLYIKVSLINSKEQNYYGNNLISREKQDLMADYFWSINEINVAAYFLVLTFISKVIFTVLIKRLHKFTFKSEIKCFETLNWKYYT